MSNIFHFVECFPPNLWSHGVFHPVVECFPLNSCGCFPLSLWSTFQSIGDLFFTQLVECFLHVFGVFSTKFVEVCPISLWSLFPLNSCSAFHLVCNRTFQSLEIFPPRVWRIFHQVGGVLPSQFVECFPLNSSFPRRHVLLSPIELDIIYSLNKDEFIQNYVIYLSVNRT